MTVSLVVAELALASHRGLAPDARNQRGARVRSRLEALFGVLGFRVLGCLGFQGFRVFQGLGSLGL